MNTDEQPAARIITISNPGYEVVLFFDRDGGAEAVITQAGQSKQPTRVRIAPPAPGRRIVVERRGATMEVWYRNSI